MKKLLCVLVNLSLVSSSFALADEKPAQSVNTQLTAQQINELVTAIPLDHLKEMVATEKQSIEALKAGLTDLKTEMSGKKKVQEGYQFNLDAHNVSLIILICGGGFGAITGVMALPGTGILNKQYRAAVMESLKKNASMAELVNNVRSKMRDNTIYNDAKFYRKIFKYSIVAALLSGWVVKKSMTVPMLLNEADIRDLTESLDKVSADIKAQEDLMNLLSAQIAIRESLAK